MTLLQQHLQADLQALKTVTLGIIPAKLYYRDLFLGILVIYTLFLLIQFIGCGLAMHINVWGYVNANEKSHSDFLMDYYHHSSASWRSWAEIQQRKQESEAEFFKQREHSHTIRVFKMVTGCIFSSLFFLLFFIAKVKNYIIFKHQLQPRLLTGKYLSKKIKQALMGFFGIFGITATIAIPLFDQDMTFFAGIAAFLITGIISTVIINMEVSRIGVSVLSTAIAEYFAGDKNTSGAK